MNIQQVIDHAPITKLHIRVLAICFVLNMLDGMDVLIISFAAPIISDTWNVSPQALGMVFSAALLGMAAGAVFISPLSDKQGRKQIIVGSMVGITLGIWLTALSGSVMELTFARFISGLGIGSMLASLTSIVSEFAPKKHRSMAILTLHAAYPIGAILAGFLAAWIMPIWGWQQLFIVAASISLIVIPIVILFLPESLDFLVSRQPTHALAKINKVLTEVGASTLEALPPVNSEAKQQKTGIASVLTPSIRQATVMLWLAFMFAFASLYFLFSWVVKLAVDSGLPLQDATLAGISLNLGAFFGSILLGWLASRFGLVKVIAIFFPLGAISTAIYGNADFPLWGVLCALFTLMFFVQGAFTGLYAIAASLYPTSIRTTGVGWAIGAGRVGAISGPAIAGMLIGAQVSLGWTFIFFSLPLLFATVIVLKINQFIKH